MKLNGYVIGVLAFFGILIAMSVYSGSKPGEYDEFAACIAESGAKIYSAWWCPHCQAQKKDFGKSFKVLDEMGAHIECSPGGTKSFSQFCLDEGITGTPTWKFADGSVRSGKLSFAELSQRTGCVLQKT